MATTHQAGGRQTCKKVFANLFAPVTANLFAGNKRNEFICRKQVKRNATQPLETHLTQIIFAN
jgi:hypothetical protein